MTRVEVPDYFFNVIVFQKPFVFLTTNRHVYSFFPNKTDVAGKKRLADPSAESSAGVVNSLDAALSLIP